GSKCTAWADDGGNWNAHKCVPVARDPAGPGEPCTVMESAVSGLDDCEEGSICWNVDHDTSQGTCYAFCRHYPEACDADPVGCCPAGYYVHPHAILPLCWKQCDPFVQDCEGSGEACYPGGNTFQCTPDVSGDAGAIGDPCEYINTCDPGTYCGDPATFPGC